MFPDDSFAYDEPVDLNPQQSYTITLNYTKIGRLFSISQAVITITDDPEEVPVVGIVPPANIQSINPSEQVTLQAYVDSYFNTTIKWSSPSDLPGYGRLNMTDPNVISTPNQYQLVSSISKLSTESGDLRKYLLVTSEDDDDLRSVYLSILPDSLRPGIPYRFRVTATNEFGSNFAEVTIKTAPVPSGCHVIVEPPIGQALDTFVIQAVGCVVEPTRYPLIYRYGTKRTNDDEIEWLGGVTYRSSLASLLPVGNRDDGFELLVFARVEDNQGVHQTFSSTAIINDSNSTNLTLHEARIATKAATHWRSALRSLQAVLSTINADPTRFVPEQVDSFKSVSVGVLNDLSTHSIPRQKGDLMQLLVILQELTEKTDANNVADANTKTVISLVESAVSDVVNSDVENHFDAGFSAHEGAQVLTIYSNLLPDEHNDVVQNQVTESLRRVVDKVGFGMCKQQTYGSVKESAVFGLGALETSISTPLGQHRVGCSLETTTNCNINDDDNLLVDYDSSLSRGYLTWSCHNNETCNGVCTVSAHITANLFQTPSVHDPVHKSDTISLSLLDPKSGEELEIGNLDEPVVFTLKLTVPSERNGEVQCVYRDEELDRMSTDGCVTRLDDGVSDTDVLPIGSPVYCECNHLSVFLVVEQCPPGFYGNQCEHKCPQGLWGIDCSKSCDCNSRGPCYHVDGQCDCQSGWIGERCDTSCVEGFWGKNCSTVCDCQNGAACSPETGTCTCAEGWMGANCNTSCAAGYYGFQCQEQCQCQNDANCSAVTGMCTCSPGYQGDYCSENCHKGTYGSMCQNCSCHSSGTLTCHHVTGECTCREKWNGTYCQNAIPEPFPPSAEFPIWTIAVVLIIVILVVVGILLYFYYRKRKRGKMVVSPVDENDGQGDEEDEIVITKARSMEFILRTRPDTRDRIAWEVAKVKESRKKKRKADDNDVYEEPTVEILPKRIRLKPDATLADLREALMEEDWFEEGVALKFLLRGDQRLFYSRDQEPVVILAQVFVENEGFRTIHVLESKEVRKRKKSRGISGHHKNDSLRKKALRNASASSQVTGSQASMSMSYTSYTTDVSSYTDSFSDSEEGEYGSETEHTQESAFEDERASYSNPSPSQSLSGSQSQISEEIIDTAEAQPPTVDSDPKTFRKPTDVTTPEDQKSAHEETVEHEETAKPSTVASVRFDCQSEQTNLEDSANFPTEAETPKVDNESRD